MFCCWQRVVSSVKIMVSTEFLPNLLESQQIERSSLNFSFYRKSEF